MAETDAARTVLTRTHYAPYGEALNRTVDGPGYTGHMMDAATGLVYAQQRYYDPVVGRFLSIDPVAADPNTGSNFNRYWYANNNPYTFTDPDGRQSFGFGTNQPEKILGCRETNSCITLDEARKITDRDARRVITLVGGAALTGATLGLDTELGLAPATREVIKSNVFKQVVCAVLSIGCDGKSIGRNPTDQVGRDITKIEKVFEQGLQKLKKEGEAIIDRVRAGFRSDTRSSGSPAPVRSDTNPNAGFAPIRVDEISGRIDSARLKRELDR